jgi:hypothetical protein
MPGADACAGCNDGRRGRRRGVVERDTRALRVQVDAADVANRMLLPLSGFVIPQQRIAARHVDETARLRRGITQNQHMACAELRQFGGGRRHTHEINHGHLVNGEGHVFPAVNAEVEVAIDQVFVLIAVEDDGSALALTVGEDEGGPLGGREYVDAGAHDECGG